MHHGQPRYYSVALNSLCLRSQASPPRHITPSLRATLPTSDPHALRRRSHGLDAQAAATTLVLRNTPPPALSSSCGIVSGEIFQACAYTGWASSVTISTSNHSTQDPSHGAQTKRYPKSGCLFRCHFSRTVSSSFSCLLCLSACLDQRQTFLSFG